MTITVFPEIRRNADGVIRRCEAFDWHDDQEHPDFIWSEGNFSCDCNRADFFARAGDEPEEEDAPCGHERFTLRLVTEDGKIVYNEFEK